MACSITIDRLAEHDDRWAPGDADSVFSREPATLWRKVFGLMQRREA